MNSELIEYIDNIIKEIEQDDSYIALLNKRDKLQNNETVMMLIEAFKEKEAAYNEVKKYGKHHPDLKRHRVAFQNAKQGLFEHEEVKEYKKHEKHIQSLLDDIVMKIQDTVSPRVSIKTQTLVNIKGGLTCKSG